jgi:hypothetical protein
MKTAIPVPKKSGKHMMQETPSTLDDKLGAMGINEDSIVAHISPKEVAMLKMLGGVGTINPKTGMLQFYGDDSDSDDGGEGIDTGGAFGGGFEGGLDGGFDFGGGVDPSGFDAGGFDLGNFGDMGATESAQAVAAMAESEAIGENFTFDESGIPGLMSGIDEEMQANILNNPAYKIARGLFSNTLGVITSGIPVAIGQGIKGLGWATDKMGLTENAQQIASSLTPSGIIGGIMDRGYLAAHGYDMSPDDKASLAQFSKDQQGIGNDGSDGIGTTFYDKLNTIAYGPSANTKSPVASRIGPSLPDYRQNKALF